jgi:hypothetical protein
MLFVFMYAFEVKKLLLFRNRKNYFKPNGVIKCKIEELDGPAGGSQWASGHCARRANVKAKQRS